MPSPIDYQINQLEMRERLNDQFTIVDHLSSPQYLKHCPNSLLGRSWIIHLGAVSHSLTFGELYSFLVLSC